MSKTTTQPAPEAKQLEIAKKLDQNIFKVMGSALQGFERAYLIANAAGALKEILTQEYMKPIMELQGIKLGFKTDKDQGGGYAEAVVKNCLIEAVLTGVQPFGNHFNIIAGNCYITKEGFGYLLGHTTGLKYEVIPSLPRINQQSGSAAVLMKISWTLNDGPKQVREIDFAIKVNQYMGADAVIGKATRKARAWLFNNLNDMEVADGDVMDVPAVVVSTKVEINKEEERMQLLIDDCKTLADLDMLRAQAPDFSTEAYDKREQEIKASLKK